MPVPCFQKIKGRTRRFLFLFSKVHFGGGTTTHSSPHHRSSKEPTYDTHIARRDKLSLLTPNYHRCRARNRRFDRPILHLRAPPFWTNSGPRSTRRLDELGHIYLDYTGGGLYADSQLREHFELLRHHVFGNPHSQSPTSRATTELVEQARAFVLTFFRLRPMNMRSSSPPMPAMRSSWSVRPIPFDPAVSSCSLPITTTPSMASASLHGPKVPSHLPARHRSRTAWRCGPSPFIP